MQLSNEAIVIRTLVGAVLGLLVNFGVKLSGVQVESILALTDAVIPLVFAVIGALSARSKVDGPKTAAEKQAEIGRLQALLEKSIALEKPPPTPRNIGPAAILLLVFGVACSGAQAAKDAATCSPNADAEFARELATVCQGRALTECPEADSIGGTYEEKAELECSKQ